MRLPDVANRLLRLERSLPPPDDEEAEAEDDRAVILARLERLAAGMTPADREEAQAEVIEVYGSYDAFWDALRTGQLKRLERHSQAQGWAALLGFDRA